MASPTRIEPPPNEIIGFDLGHGETAVTKVDVRTGEFPVALDLPGGSRDAIPTVVVTTTSGEIMVGESALTALPESVSFSSAMFKSANVGDEAVRKPLLLFVEAVVRFVGEQLDDPARARFVFGVPSGWSPPQRLAYQEILQQTGAPFVEVVAESRAALLYAAKSREFGSLKAELEGNVLVIDIGSSTTDYTWVSGAERDEPVDTGHAALGAGQIDRLLLEQAVEAHPEADAVREVLEDSPYHRTLCELRARKAKERYFLNEEHMHHAQAVVRETEAISDLYLLSFVITREVMERVLNSPIPALAGLAWRDLFRQDLEEVAMRMGAPPDLVLLTGGGSRMGFVREVAREVFGSAKVKLGKAPHLAIAQGLSLVAQEGGRVVGFRAAIRDLLASDAVTHVVEDHLDSFARPQAEAAFKGVVERVVLGAFMEWREGRLPTLNDVEAEVKRRLAADLASQATQERIAAATAHGFNAIRDDVEKLTDPICDQFRIPTGTLRLRPMEALHGAAHGDVNIGGADTVWIDDGLLLAINAVVATVVAATLFGGGTALIASSGPLAPIFAGLVALAVLAGAGDWMKEQMATKPLPLKLRKTVLSEARMRKKVLDGASETERNLVDAYVRGLVGAEELDAETATKVRAARAGLIAGIAEQIETQLNSLAKRAETLLKGT